MALVQQGRDKIAGLITGADAKVYGSTGAVLWVASSTEAHSPTSSWFAVSACASTMEATYPLRSANILQFRGVYSTTQANFQWEEWGVADATATGGALLLNKAVQQALGVKACTQTWQFTACCTITT